MSQWILFSISNWGLFLNDSFWQAKMTVIKKRPQLLRNVPNYSLRSVPIDIFVQNVEILQIYIAKYGGILYSLCMSYGF